MTSFSSWKVDTKALQNLKPSRKLEFCMLELLIHPFMALNNHRDNARVRMQNPTVYNYGQSSLPCGYHTYVSQVVFLLPSGDLENAV